MCYNSQINKKMSLPLKSILLKPHTKAKLEDCWDNLSITAQRVILSFIAESEKYERKAVEAAFNKNPNFRESYKHKIAKSQSDSLQRIEKQEKNYQEATLMEDLADI